MEFNSLPKPYILKGKSKNREATLENGSTIIIAEMCKSKETKNTSFNKISDAQIRTAFENKNIKHVWFKNEQSEKIDGKPIFVKTGQKTYSVSPNNEHKIIGFYKRGKILNEKICERQGSINGLTYDMRVYSKTQINYYHRNQHIYTQNVVDFYKL